MEAGAKIKRAATGKFKREPQCDDSRREATAPVLIDNPGYIMYVPDVTDNAYPVVLSGSPQTPRD